MDVLNELVGELEPDPNTLSIVLIGSGARGELDAFSDLDVHVVMRGERPADRMFYRQGRLINVNFLDRQNREAALLEPWMAFCNLSAIRGAQILFDPDGWYADLQQRAKDFTWSSLAKEANTAISWILAENGEWVQKILGGLAKGNLEKTLYATVSLLNNLTTLGAYANGVLPNSENRLWSAVRDGEADSAWKTFYWTALGFNSESVAARAEAALQLYQRSAGLHRAKLLPQHLEMVEQVLRLIEARN